MDSDQRGPGTDRLVQEVAGYLNFSSGASDPKFLRAVNALFADVARETGDKPGEAAWRLLGDLLRRGLSELGGRAEAFRQADQAAAVLHLAFDEVLPAYRDFHRDLLFHQSDESLFQPFFIGRVCEAVLTAGSPWDERERIVATAIRRYFWSPVAR